MLDLSPLKVLVVLVVALVLLGPDKVPQFARQVGAAWRTLHRWHERVEQEVRSTVPDLPSAQDIARAVRSPVAFLDSLASMEPSRGPAEGSASQGIADGAPAGETGPAGPGAGTATRAERNGHAPAGPAGSTNGQVTTGHSFRLPDNPGMN